jgi:gamma-glutamylcyclotransferase (GGCT)/AIG2-like uncharacterized protein YtfP
MFPALGTRTLFAYGTLLRGERNHSWLERARHLGDAQTEPRFELVDLGTYPALVPEGEGSIRGEVYGLSEEDVVVIDELEAHPAFYVRTPIRLADGTMAEAYLLQPDQVRGLPRIESGDWRRRPR